eukprot:g685.t1
MLSNKTKKPSEKSKTREFRRAEFLLLEAQKTLLEQRIHQLEKVGEANLIIGRKMKRDPTGLALPDRSKGNKRTKHELPVSLEDMFNECRKLLNQLKRNKNAWPFLSPVDPVAVNCPDYFTIIKHPMDFKTIGNKLRATKRKYQTPLDFRDDVRLVFKNCMMYNPEGNQIRIMGDLLSDVFENLWRNTNIERLYQEQTRILSRDKSGHQGQVDEDGVLVSRGRAKRKKGRNMELSLKRLSDVNSKLVELTSTVLNNSQSGEVMDIDQPMSYWQRRQLSQELNSAPVEKLRLLYPVLQELDEGEFVFDELADALLWKIQSIMSTNQSRFESNMDTAVVTPPVICEKQTEVETQDAKQIAEQDAEQTAEQDAEQTAEQDAEQTAEQTAEQNAKQNAEQDSKQTDIVQEMPVKTEKAEDEVKEESGKISARAMEIEVQNEAGGFGCCEQGIMKDSTRSNGNKDLIEEPNS